MSRKHVNRCLKDEAFDRIDHALGRPVHPLEATYRDHYAASAGSPAAAAMAASPYWTDHGIRWDLHLFTVTAEGRKALAEHLRSIGDANRLWSLTFGGITSDYVATSAGKARYAAWLGWSDSMPDLDFATFCRRTRVRLAR